MAGLASEVIGGAQNATDQLSSTVGDALKAYQVSTDAQQAREKLEMDKQQHEMSKANWVIQNVGKISRTLGPAQNIMLDNFGKAMQRISPGFDPKLVDIMKKSPEDMQKIAWAMDQFGRAGGAQNPDQAAHVLDAFGGDIDKYTDFLDKVDQQQALIKSGQAKASGMQGRVDEMKNQNAAAAGSAFEKDDIIKNTKKNLNSLEKSSSILFKANGPVTAKDLNLAYNDYMNATAPGGNSTEGKVNRELPDTYAQELNTLLQNVGATQDLRKTKQGKALIDQLLANITNVRKDSRKQILDQFENVADDYRSNTNPRVQDTIRTKRAAYQKTYANVPSEGAASGGAGSTETIDAGASPSYPEGTIAKTKDGQDVIWKGGAWVKK